MFNICRDEFIYYLRQGKVSVLGSVTGIEGVYTVQGTSNGIYICVVIKRGLFLVLQ